MEFDKGILWCIMWSLLIEMLLAVHGEWWYRDIMNRLLPFSVYKFKVLNNLVAMLSFVNSIVISWSYTLSIVVIGQTLHSTLQASQVGFSSMAECRNGRALCKIQDPSHPPPPPCECPSRCCSNLGEG